MIESAPDKEAKELADLLLEHRLLIEENRRNLAIRILDCLNEKVERLAKNE